MTRRIVLISTADGNSNEGRIVRNLHAVLQQTLQVRLVMTRLHKRSVFGALSGVLRQIRCVAQSDDVVIHSPFVLSAPAAFAARLLRKRLIAFVWDSYPVLIAGRRYDRRISRWLFDRFEILVPWLVTTKIIPTHDFYIDPKYHKAQVIPFWTGLTEHAGKGQTGVRGASGPRKIALIGQINETRGVAQALLHLDKILVHPAEVHLFSRDPAPEICAMPFEKLTVQHHGFLGHDAMLERLRGFDFGLVTLHPQFDMPGFPSKTLDYLSLSLPVLYFGRGLPAYTDLLLATGAGVVVTDLASLDLDEQADRLCDIALARFAFVDKIIAKTGAFDHVFAEPVR